MITHKEINFSAYSQTNKLISLDWKSRLIVHVARLLQANETACKLEFFERMLNYLRVVALKALSANLHIKLNNSSIISDTESYEDRVSRSFVEFLYQFEIIILGEEGLNVNSRYRHLIENEIIDKLLSNREIPYGTNISEKEKRMINDFLFVNDLMQKYSNPDYSFQYIKKRRHIWESLVNEKKLDYEIRLCETLFNLVHLKIPEKIESPFDEDYYTESGQNAFKNFTRFSFLKFLQDITKENDNISVFDLGCGYGNYIGVIHENFPNCTVTGIEKNSMVFSQTRKKFEKSGNVEIINDDFFAFVPGKMYDVLLMNYVLFYFNFEEKKKLLEKAKSIINKGGSIVLCQYFSGIEDLKRELAKKQNDYTMSKKIEMYYSDKILYANTLWNDAVDTFSEAVRWNEFNAIIGELDLQIVSITNADKFYYSLFVELKAVQSF